MLTYPKTKTTEVYSGCFMLKKQVVTKQMCGNKFKTKNCNVGIDVIHRVMVREYLQVLKDLEDLITAKKHRMNIILIVCLAIYQNIQTTTHQQR